MKEFINSNTKIDPICLITTSRFSLNQHHRLPSTSEGYSVLLYPCIEEGSCESIPSSRHYEVILDFNNPKINSIMFSLFNKLLPMAAGIFVLAVNCPLKPDAEGFSCIELLKKLEKNHLIELEIVGAASLPSIEPFPGKRLHNVACFIGPGNTGKTSILSSVSEIFEAEKQRVALLDLTNTHKLGSYFPHSIEISDERYFYSDQSIGDLQPVENLAENPIAVYTIKAPIAVSHASSFSYVGIVEKLSKFYDHVIVNMSSDLLPQDLNIFELASKIFIVYDLTPTKISSSHQLLYRLNKLGALKQKTVSIIYNKIERKAFDIRYFEGNVIFDRTPDYKLVPLIDVRCNTFEIPYSKQTMAALNHKYISHTNAVFAASKKYTSHIRNIYKLISTGEYRESSEMQLSEYISFMLKQVGRFLPIRFSKQAFAGFAKRIKLELPKLPSSKHEL